MFENVIGNKETSANEEYEKYRGTPTGQKPCYDPYTHSWVEHNCIDLMQYGYGGKPKPPGWPFVKPALRREERQAAKIFLWGVK